MNKFCVCTNGKKSSMVRLKKIKEKVGDKISHEIVIGHEEKLELLQWKSTEEFYIEKWNILTSWSL